MTDHGLGRIRAPDPRDSRHLLRPWMLSRIVRHNIFWPYVRPVLDQGQTGTCVGHGWKHWMMTAPITQTKPDADPTAFTIYDEAILLDEWTENDADPGRQYGTSVRAGAKALQARGFLVEYGWAFSADTAIDWLCSQGPVVIGVNWYGSMFDPEKNGFLRISGSVAGGHCVCLVGWSESRGAARLLNSWGVSWGQRGRAWLAGEDLERLINENGEVCTALEIRRL